MFFFFFKQKTAYEMRISDWSSDVCSSDLSTETGRSGSQTQAPSSNRASGGGSIPAPLPSTEARTRRNPAPSMRYSSRHHVFSTEWRQASVKAPSGTGTNTAAAGARVRRSDVHGPAPPGPPVENEKAKDRT